MFKSFVNYVAVAAIMLGVGVMNVMAEPSGPSADLGVDISTTLSGAATDVGTYVGWGVTLAFGVIALWKAVKYFRRAA